MQSGEAYLFFGTFTGKTLTDSEVHYLVGIASVIQAKEDLRNKSYVDTSGWEYNFTFNHFHKAQ